MIKWDFLGNNDIFSKVFVTNIWEVCDEAVGDLPTLIKEFYVRSAVRAERTRAAHLLLRMSTGHSWCALTASPTKCSTHRFPSRSATLSHRMPLSGIKATRASASPQNNIICSFGGPDNTMDVGARTQKQRTPKIALRGSESGGYLLSHNMQYHRRCWA